MVDDTGRGMRFDEANAVQCGVRLLGGTRPRALVVSNYGEE
jgi:hypothetical protein